MEAYIIALIFWGIIAFVVATPIMIMAMVHKIIEVSIGKKVNW